MITNHPPKAAETLIDQIKGLPKEESLENYQVLLKQLQELPPLETAEDWLLSYYEAICWVRMGFLEPDESRKDHYFDKAESFIRKGIRKYPNESEWYVLRALMNQGRILVSVIARGMRYINEIENDLRRAKRLAPENPRAYFLLGQSYLNKPGFIGGSKQTALYYFKKAKEKFEKQAALNSPLHPTWGEQENEEALKQLK